MNEWSFDFFSRVHHRLKYLGLVILINDVKCVDLNIKLIKENHKEYIATTKY